MPVWAMCLALIWLWFIPHFTAASLKAIVHKDPNPKELPAKVVSLLVGLIWPIIFVIGLYQIMTRKD